MRITPVERRRAMDTLHTPWGVAREPRAANRGRVSQAPRRFPRHFTLGACVSRLRPFGRRLRSLALTAFHASSTLARARAANLRVAPLSVRIARSGSLRMVAGHQVMSVSSICRTSNLCLHLRRRKYVMPLWQIGPLWRHVWARWRSFPRSSRVSRLLAAREYPADIRRITGRRQVATLVSESEVRAPLSSHAGRDRMA